MVDNKLRTHLKNAQTKKKIRILKKIFDWRKLYDRIKCLKRVISLRKNNFQP